MKFKATFKSNNKSFKADFGQVIKVTDGGYERGYAAGHEEGFASGHKEGFAAGESSGYTAGYEDGFAAGESSGSGGFPIGDGKTHIGISLPEGRTSPRLRVCPKGTVTVDWGDGTEPDILTGTSTSTVKYTPNHNYAESGDYIITLTVDGEMGFYMGILEHDANSDSQNQVYKCAIRRLEIADGATSIGNSAFYNCHDLESVTIPNSVTSIGSSAFNGCHSLASVTIPNSVTSIGSSAFSRCYSLESVTISNGVTSISSDTFNDCKALVSVTIPNSVTSIKDGAFKYCYSLATVTIPNSVTSIANNAFYDCKGVRYYDFTKSTTVPTLGGTYAFRNIASDCEIRVPAALADEWKAATNWATYADKIVGV